MGVAFPPSQQAVQSVLYRDYRRPTAENIICPHYFDTRVVCDSTVWWRVSSVDSFSVWHDVGPINQHLAVSSS